jgi:anti-repressor protein
MSASNPSTTALQPFSFAGQQVRVITDEHGEPWFTARDVCAVLDLGNVSMAVGRLADDEQSTISSTEGGPARLLISEAGLYRLIFTSRKVEAEAFRRWVTHEVLPAIRKTGGYTTQPAPPAFVIPQTMSEALRLAADEHERALEAEAKVAELEPKADLADTYLIAQGGTRKVREAAKLLHLRERDLRRMLIDERLVFTRHARCGDVQYDFYAEFAHHFQAIEHVVNHTWGSCSHYTLVITPRGMDLIKRRMARIALPADEAAAQLAVAR